MLSEYDVVKANHDLSSKVVKSQVGTVIMVFYKPSLAYEVEFVNDKGDTVGLLTVQPSDIEKVGLKRRERI